MKIAFLIGTLQQGGAERQVVETANLLAENGHEIIIYYYNSDNCHYKIQNKNVSLKLLKIDNYYTRYKSLKKTIMIDKPRYMISFLERTNMYLGIVGLLNKNKIKSRLIASERNTYLLYNTSIKWKYIFKIAYRGIDDIFCNSTVAINNVTKTLNYPREKIFLLRNYINTEKFNIQRNLDRNEILKYSENIDLEKNLFLVPARITNQKNQKILISITEQLLNMGINNFQFILAGKLERPYYDELTELIKEKKLQSKIIYIGNIEDVGVLYNLFDFILLTSIYEGFPNVILEGMACGKVCISTNVSDIECLINDGTTGFIANNEKELIEKISKCIDMNNAEIERIGQNALIYISKEFTKEAYINNLFKILKKES